MKKKYNEGSSLVEILISLVILAIIVVPTCTSLVLSFRMNEKAESLMQEQFAVSSAVETLMAEGITDQYLRSLIRHELIGENEADRVVYYRSYLFAGLRFELVDRGGYFDVTVTGEEEQITVTTRIRDKSSSGVWEGVSGDE